MKIKYLESHKAQIDDFEVRFKKLENDYEVCQKELTKSRNDLKIQMNKSNESASNLEEKDEIIRMLNAHLKELAGMFDSLESFKYFQRFEVNETYLFRFEGE